MQLATIEVLVAGRRMPLNRVTLICDDPSLTKQAFSKDSDIRTILARYAKTGILGDPAKTPIFGDFSNTDYQASLDLVARVKSNFETLPVELRDRFDNSASNLLDFVADESNLKEAQELGLLEKPIATEPVAIPPVTAAIPPPAVLTPAPPAQK